MAHPKPLHARSAFSGWFKLARAGDVADECARFTLNQPLQRALVVRVGISKELMPALQACMRANTLVWNRSVILSTNGLSRKAIADRAMIARKKEEFSAISVISTAVLYATVWCASMMHKGADVTLTPKQISALQIPPGRRAFMLARQGCTIERGEIKFPGVGYLKIRDQDLFDRFYSLHGRWTALVLRGRRLYVVIDAPAPLEMLKQRRLDYKTRLEAVEGGYNYRVKKDPLGRRSPSRKSLLVKLGKKLLEQQTGQAKGLEQASLGST